MASAAVTIWSEVLARVKKTPAQQYLIVGLIPLVPGAPLYYAMSALVQSDVPQAMEYGYRTAAFALGIAAGVSLTASVLEMVLRARKQLRKKNSRE